MSIREEIIQNVVETLDESGLISRVIRIVPEQNDIERLPAGDFPVVSVLGRLPEVTYPDFYSAASSLSTSMELTSLLEIELYIHGKNDKQSDEEISVLVAEIWKLLHKDRSRGGLCSYTRLQPELIPIRQLPYFSFLITLECKYKHNYEDI